MVKTATWGIEEGYENALGEWYDTPEGTRLAVLAAMGADPSLEGPPEDPAVKVVWEGARPPRLGKGDLTLEDGRTIPVSCSIPRNLPVGYHTFCRSRDGKIIKLICCPRTCYLPQDLSTWGWTVQLYALRSKKSWGFGDFADLRDWAQWSADKFGAGIVVVNPLHAATPVLPQQPSPYTPSTRCYKNLLYLRIEEVPGARELLPNLDDVVSASRKLNVERKIDRDAVFQLKMRALEQLWSRFSGDDGFDNYCREEGDLLTHFATFCSLAERFRSGWRNWPPEFRHPKAPDVIQFANEWANRVRFFQWVQWLLDIQFSSAAGRIRVMQDLPIGTDPDGADAWLWRDLIADDVTLGAPPDEYNTQGQDWGLSAFVPHKLREAAYEPFVQMIRHTLRHAGGLRVDHVMGLFRLYWIPKAMGAARGAYVRYPAEDLLGILALESQRAKAFVVGEDLGTVDPEAVRKLQRRNVLSYRLLWFEKRHPRHFPRRALAATTTHDLPTISGVWTGKDLEKQEELGLNPNKKGMQLMRRRLQAVTGLPKDSDVDKVIVRTYEALVEAPSSVVAASLEDALGIEERPNMPGTVGNQHPNWCLALPQPIELLIRDPKVAAVANAVSRPRGGKRKHPLRPCKRVS